MTNTHKTVHPDVQRIVDNQDLSKSDKITELKKIYDDERALQRAATESPMAKDDGLNERLQDVELALKELNADVKGPEDNLGATL